MSKKSIPKVTNPKRQKCKECKVSLETVQWIQRGSQVYCRKHDPKNK